MAVRLAAGLLLSAVLLAGCAGSGCEEWASKEVVNHNFCTLNGAARNDGMLISGQREDCVAPGTSQEFYCVERPETDGQPVNH